MTDYEVFLNVLLYDCRELEQAVKNAKKDLLHRKLVDIRAGCNRLLEMDADKDA